MPPPVNPTDDDSIPGRLWNVERTQAEWGWRLVTVERLLEKIAPMVEANSQWRRDLERADAERARGLSRREKQLGTLLVLLGPALSVIVAHFVR